MIRITLLLLAVVVAVGIFASSTLIPKTQAQAQVVQTVVLDNFTPKDPSVFCRLHESDLGHRYGQGGPDGDCVVVKNDSVLKKTNVVVMKGDPSDEFELTIKESDNRTLLEISPELIEAVFDIVDTRSRLRFVMENYTVTIERQSGKENVFITIFANFVDGSGGSTPENIIFGNKTGEFLFHDGTLRLKLGPSLIVVYWDDVEVGRVTKTPVSSGSKHFTIVASGPTKSNPAVAIEKLRIDALVDAPSPTPTPMPTFTPTPTPMPTPTPPPPVEHRVVVIIDRVEPLEGGCDGDRYFKVTIEGQEFVKKSPVFDVTTTNEIIPVVIEVWKEGRFGFPDKQCDVDPGVGKALQILYSITDGTYSGDSTTSDGKLVTNSRGDESNAAEVCFGISDGNYVSFCQMEVWQITPSADHNGDGVKADVVAGRPVSLHPRMRVHGTTPDPRTSFVFELVNSKLGQPNVTMSFQELNANAGLGAVVFIPHEGSQEVHVRVVQQDRFVSKIRQKVLGKPARIPKIAVMAINGCEGTTLCGSLTGVNYKDDIKRGRDGILATYPVVDVEMVDLGLGPLADANTKFVDPSDPASPTEGMVATVDMVCRVGKARAPHSEFFVGIVPDGFFKHHFEYGIKGIAWIGGPTCVLVEEGYGGLGAAHEIDHTLGIDHPDQNNPPAIKGFYIFGEGASIRGNFIPATTPNLMCSGTSGCAPGKSMPPSAWPDEQTVSILREEFLEDVKDPKLRLLSGRFIRQADGTITFELGKIGSLPEGTISRLSPGLGGFSIRVLDEGGNLLFELPFGLSFKFGGREVTFASFFAAVPFPQEAAKIEIVDDDGTQIAELDPRVEQLEQVLGGIPVEAFKGKKSEKQANKKERLLKKFGRFLLAFAEGKLEKAQDFLEGVRERVVNQTNDFVTDSDLPKTKKEVINVIDETGLQLFGSFPPEPKKDDGEDDCDDDRDDREKDGDCDDDDENNKKEGKKKKNKKNKDN